ncbi:biotin carboxylase N-terminal domain-containing protein [Phenylobacterium sp.]|uniref:biotin carboxylase N-terminal domain-containing protein n=1 Tax=Phenylobacterium sp. TaxID=1871053 RepID=UPI003BA8ABED
MVAKRSEIAIRVFRAAAELAVRTIAINAEEDRLSLHRFRLERRWRVPSPRSWRGRDRRCLRASLC